MFVCVVCMVFISAAGLWAGSGYSFVSVNAWGTSSFLIYGTTAHISGGPEQAHDPGRVGEWSYPLLGHGAAGYHKCYHLNVELQ